MHPYLKMRGGSGVRRRKRGFLERVQKSINEPTSKTSIELQNQMKVGGLSVLWVVTLFFFLLYAVPLLKLGVIFSRSTLEKCKIISYAENECQYNCDCKYIVGPNGDHQRFCQKCDGHQYTYTVTAESKCGGNQLLTQTKHEYVCPEQLYEAGEMLECMVPDCHYQTFTYHTHVRILIEAVSYSAVCVCLMLWIPYTLWMSGDKDSKFTR